MAKIIFLITIMFLSSYLTEQAKVLQLHDSIVDETNKETKILKVSR